MKKIKICILILCSNMIFAQQNYFDNYNILAKGDSEENGYTEYLMGSSSPHLKYNYVDMKKTPDAKLPKYKELDYEKILNGGLNSFLFENKYYGDLSYYSLFGWGNFSVMGKEVLKLANEVFFPNRKLLNLVYGYYAPEYKKAFTKLSVPEQSLYLSKLDVDEKFVKFVLQEKNRERYETWLKKNNLKHDHYITEFMERRVKKGQWKIADCNYWIKKVRKDFEPLKKNPKIKAYYFYEQLNLGDSLLLLIDHEGNQFFADKDFNRCNDKIFYNISNENGMLKGGFDINSVFNNPNGITYMQLGDSLCFYKIDFGRSLLYDFKNRKIMLDSLILAEIGYLEGKSTVSFYSHENPGEQILMIGQFYIDESKMPDYEVVFDPDDYSEKRFYDIHPIYDMAEVVAHYYLRDNNTVLLDFKKGIMKEFEGKGTIVPKDEDYEFLADRY